MSEEKEGLEAQEDEELRPHLNAPVAVYVTEDDRIRLKRKARNEGIHINDFIRVAFDLFLQEDERVQFLLKKAKENTRGWKSWGKYRAKQKKEDKEQYEKFTDEEVESIFTQIMGDGEDDL